MFMCSMLSPGLLNPDVSCMFSLILIKCCPQIPLVGLNLTETALRHNITKTRLPYPDVSRFLLNITFKHSLSLFDPFFHSLLTPDHVTSPITPMWIKEWLILLLSLDSRTEPACFWLKKEKKRRSLKVCTCTFEKQTYSTRSSWKMPKDNCDSGVHLMLIAHANSLGFLSNPRVAFVI